MAKNKKTSKANKSSKRWLWIAGSAVGVILVAGLIWFAAANSAPRAMPTTNSADIAAMLPNSDNGFNVGTMVGKPAPAFTLPDAQSKPYQFQPGNGKKYVLAFNMGYA